MELTFWAWTITAVILIGAEILSSGLYLLPFGLGAATAAAITAANGSPGWQWVGFLGVSSVLTVVIRRTSLARRRRG